MLRFLSKSFPFLLFLLLLPALRGAVPALLQEVTDRMVSEREQWAFTQLVREFDGDKVAVERLERYDPARGYEHRWQLLKLNGRTPTAAEAEEWSKRKNRPHKRPAKAVADYLDLEHARVAGETADSVNYDVPFKRSAGGLFPGEKVELNLLISKRTRAIERAQVSLDESFNVALGLAKIVDIDLDLEMPDAGKPATAEHPEKTKGTATAVVNKLGRRFEYRWSDFTRHPARESAAKEASR
jgi:hypothetical protein